MPTFRILALAAALPLVSLGTAQAADMDVRTVAPSGERQLTITRTAAVAVDCSVRPVIVAPGRRGMGEPGTYYARWDFGVPAGCAPMRR
jgi:hypothetical protein